MDGLWRDISGEKGDSVLVDCNQIFSSHIGHRDLLYLSYEEEHILYVLDEQDRFLRVR